MNETTKTIEGEARGTDQVSSGKTAQDSGLLRDHWSQVLVLFVSLLAAACYMIGRAKLLGWYDAAGIPALLFSWSFQDVVMRGLADKKTWLLAFVIGVLGVTAFAISDWLSTWLYRSARSDRGEGWDRLGLRKRWAHRARELRLQRHPDAKKASENWRTLGRRGRRNLVRAKVQGRESEASSSSVLSVLLILMLVLGFCVHFLVNFVYGVSYRQGYRSYWLEHIAATEGAPIGRSPKGWGEKSLSFEVTAEMKAEGRANLQSYAYVQVSVLGSDKAAEPAICGWLVQGTGSQLILLNKEGLQVLTFADLPFKWRSIAPDQCEPRKGA